MEILGSELRRCKICQEETWHTARRSEVGPHYGYLTCDICGERWGWLSKPDNQGKRPKNKYTPASLGVDRCQMCLRDRSELVNSETLEVHHIIEVSAQGQDTPENIMVLCTPCHRLTHYQRTYLRRANGEYDR